MIILIYQRQLCWKAEAWKHRPSFLPLIVISINVSSFCAHILTLSLSSGVHIFTPLLFFCSLLDLRLSLPSICLLHIFAASCWAGGTQCVGAVLFAEDSCPRSCFLFRDSNVMSKTIGSDYWRAALPSLHSVRDHDRGDKRRASRRGGGLWKELAAGD